MSAINYGAVIVGAVALGITFCIGLLVYIIVDEVTSNERSENE